jgi:hypothetical protein
MSQNPNYVQARRDGREVNNYPPIPVYRDPDEFIDWDGQREQGRVTGLGKSCILGKDTISIGCNIIAGDNSIAIGHDIAVDQDCIVIGSANHKKVLIGGVDVLDRLQKLEEMVGALWDAPGMPGSNLVCEKFIGGEN